MDSRSFGPIRADQVESTAVVDNAPSTELFLAAAVLTGFALALIVVWARASSS